MSEPAKETQTQATTGEPVKKKGGKKLIIAIIFAIVLLGGAGGGFYYWRSSSVSAAEKEGKDSKKSRAKKESSETKKEEEEKKPEKDEAKKEEAKKEEGKSLEDALPDDEDVKQVIQLDPFIINLADTEQARYLRLTVSLGIEGEAGAKEKPNPLFLTRVRNAILAVLSNKKSEEVLSIEGKTKLRKELLRAAQAASTDPEVAAVYITDFIVQL
jgi:flagellar FliL protein